MTHLSDFPEPTLVAVNGVELEVFEAGQENAGNPIVLCHGWPEQAYSWRHQIRPSSPLATTSSSPISGASETRRGPPR